MEITVKIERLDEILSVLGKLGGGCSCNATSTPTQVPNVPTQTVPTTVVPTTQSISQTAPQIQTTLQPTQASVGVPTSTPAYTLEQLSVAGGALMTDPMKTQALQNLLKEFNVQALPALPPEHYNAFAVRLRELGAQI